MISAVYVNYNTAEKLERSLQSIKNFALETIVLDLGSSDNTKEICKKFNAIVFEHKKVAYVELIRDYAISKASGDWILVLDPDEEISSQLKKKLEEVTKQDKFIAVNIPRKNIFFGHWITHTNWWPDKHIRFFKKDKVKWDKKIHSYPKVEGKILNLEAKENLAIVHLGYDSIHEFLDRQNRYSEIVAESLYEEGVRFSWGLFFWKPAREFLVRFLRHAGFLDGFYGLVLTYLMMLYQLQVMIKLWEKQKK